MRSAVAAAFAGFSKSMYNSLGPQKTGTVMALLSLIFISIPILLMKSGIKMRQSSILPTRRSLQDGSPSGQLVEDRVP
jgi:hypothetical protein